MLIYLYQNTSVKLILQALLTAIYNLVEGHYFMGSLM